MKTGLLKSKVVEVTGFDEESRRHVVSFEDGSGDTSYDFATKKFKLISGPMTRLEEYSTHPAKRKKTEYFPYYEEENIANKIRKKQETWVDDIYYCKDENNNVIYLKKKIFTLDKLYKYPARFSKDRWRRDEWRKHINFDYSENGANLKGKGRSRDALIHNNNELGKKLCKVKEEPIHLLSPYGRYLGIPKNEELQTEFCKQILEYKHFLTEEEEEEEEEARLRDRKRFEELVKNKQFRFHRKEDDKFIWINITDVDGEILINLDEWVSDLLFSNTAVEEVVWREYYGWKFEIINLNVEDVVVEE